MSGTGTILYIVLIVALMWFLLIRPQKQQAKKRNAMLKELTTGTKIITIGGICGKIKALTDTKVFLEIAEGLTIEMLRTSIAQVDTSSDEEVEEDDEEEYEYEDDEDADVYYDEDGDDDRLNEQK